MVGCNGSDGPERAVVNGSVTFQGTPVANGRIAFYPTGDTKGPMSGGPIVNGKYEVRHKGGVVCGTNLVKIFGYREQPLSDEAKEMAQVESRVTESLRIQYVPSKYNEKTELEVVVSSGEDTVPQDFNLQ